jgi:hypothetical protein
MTYQDPFDEWFIEEKGSSDEFELELDVDEVDYDSMEDEPEDY